jgi:hypothetical protein
VKRPLDVRAISASIFLPLLLWTGTVIAMTLAGYPGVVLMTPAAWLLAVPVGLRLRRESSGPNNQTTVEAGVAGGLLGLWQGLLFTALIAAAPLLPLPRAVLLDQAAGGAHPALLGAIAIFLGVPLTASLAVLITRIVVNRERS